MEANTPTNKPRCTPRYPSGTRAWFKLLSRATTLQMHSCSDEEECKTQECSKNPRAEPFFRQHYKQAGCIYRESGRHVTSQLRPMRTRLLSTALPLCPHHLALPGLADHPSIYPNASGYPMLKLAFFRKFFFIAITRSVPWQDVHQEQMYVGELKTCFAST